MKPGFEKRFNKEDLVYWCHKKAHEYSVQYGLVDEQFSDAVIIDYIVQENVELQTEYHLMNLRARKDIENIETRISGGEIQWRYLNKKRWCNIEL